ncbi:MAG: 50S ribosomal protein L22 [Spirochaetales bacterium]|nr:50S ribosomal protein L22 [Spirochaetales bacterium]
MAEKIEYKATARFVWIAPSKVRPLADIVRKKPYPEAIALLETMPQKGARILKKVIQSAAANAMYRNKKIDEDMLYVHELQVNDGPRAKRIWARARRRADVQYKRSSHVMVTVSEI